ncbi:MAG: DUF1294 domain-containing protein [Clostridia bacterium]|nr:DUF1294 domain-containing protein [Clostridia bacterium]MBO7400007.1 DUF1294 domain-containing protein [Clostridia bacterium]MBP5237718.1 DUF1294 domain-containing protein [Clostridia bacterium]MBR5031589.1 DUF1294 domain-containing protein [Clostridia bacterium]
MSKRSDLFTEPEYVFVFYVCVLAAVSVAAFCIYGRDKTLAKRGGERIKEKYLLSLAAFGGAAGAFAARFVFRHKTEKGYFSLVIYTSLALQLCALLIIALAWKGVFK